METFSIIHAHVFRIAWVQVVVLDLVAGCRLLVTRLHAGYWFLTTSKIILRVPWHLTKVTDYADQLRRALAIAEKNDLNPQTSTLTRRQDIQLIRDALKNLEEADRIATRCKIQRQIVWQRMASFGVIMHPVPMEQDATMEEQTIERASRDDEVPWCDVEERVFGWPWWTGLKDGWEEEVMASL